MAFATPAWTPLDCIRDQGSGYSRSVEGMRHCQKSLSMFRCQVSGAEEMDMDAEFLQPAKTLRRATRRTISKPRDTKLLGRTRSFERKMATQGKVLFAMGKVGILNTPTQKAAI